MRRLLLWTVVLALLAPATASADTKVTSLRPWAADNLYLVRVDLDGRTTPRLEPRAKVDYLRAGQWVRIACQTTGESAYGSRLWDKVGSLYVPDHYLKTYTDGFIAGAPRCGATPPPPPPPPPTTFKPTRYVAMGDSYSSGEGAFGYLRDPGFPYACHRSRNAYSQILALRLVGRVTHAHDGDFVACSGATSADLRARQLGALSSEVSVVTVGIGGNDLGFEPIVKACIVARSDDACRQVVERHFTSDLRDRIAGAYRAIRREARRAVVIVVGYPELFGFRLFAQTCPSSGFLTRAKRAALNEGAARLDALLASLARRRGFRFVDPRAAFRDHRVCSPRPWINGVTARDVKATFHPNATGQRVLADLIAAANRDVFR